MHTHVEVMLSGNSPVSFTVICVRSAASAIATAVSATIATGITVLTRLGQSLFIGPAGITELGEQWLFRGEDDCRLRWRDPICARLRESSASIVRISSHPEGQRRLNRSMQHGPILWGCSSLSRKQDAFLCFCAHG